MTVKSQICYRIVEVDDKGNYKTLFHGVNGSRVLSKNKWIKAVKRKVTDGDPKKARPYTSGFHVLKTVLDTHDYLRKFKKPRHLKVICIKARGLRPKAHSKKPVFLADAILIPKES